MFVELMNPNPNLLVRFFGQWGRGERVGAKKFDTSLETREIKLLGGISRDFAGISRGCPKSLRKEVCVQFRSLSVLPTRGRVTKLVEKKIDTSKEGRLERAGLHRVPGTEPDRDNQRQTGDKDRRRHSNRHKQAKQKDADRVFQIWFL